MATVEKVRAVGTPVLILGRSGTGKEMIARALHATHPERPFVKINCPAIPETLIESELFGYQRGAFTGAASTFQGKAKLADGGTLFLDEIADLPLSVQPKLLRLLEEKSFEPLGSTTTVHIDVRIICATNRNLKRLIKDGAFREDLFYRINTVTIHLPPLHLRSEDILPLADGFLEEHCAGMGKRRLQLSPRVAEAFLAYPWPGNVRELRNVIERAVVLSANERLDLEDFPAPIRLVAGTTLHGDADKLATTERLLLNEALRRNRWNASAAARELGISRDTIRYRIRKHGLAGG